MVKHIEKHHTTTKTTTMTRKKPECWNKTKKKDDRIVDELGKQASKRIHFVVRTKEKWIIEKSVCVRMGMRVRVRVNVRLYIFFYTMIKWKCIVGVHIFKSSVLLRFDIESSRHNELIILYTFDYSNSIFDSVRCECDGVCVRVDLAATFYFYFFNQLKFCSNFNDACSCIDSWYYYFHYTYAYTHLLLFCAAVGDVGVIQCLFFILFGFVLRFFSMLISHNIIGLLLSFYLYMGPYTQNDLHSYLMNSYMYLNEGNWRQLNKIQYLYADKWRIHIILFMIFQNDYTNLQMNRLSECVCLWQTVLFARCARAQHLHACS